MHRRAETQRLQAADLGAALVARRVDATGETLQLLTSRHLLRGALRAQDGQAIQKHLVDLRTTNRDYLVAAVFDARGMMLMADPLVPDQLGRDFSHRDYFVGAMESSGPYVSEIFATAAGPSPTAVSISLAVRDGSDVIGIVVMGLSPAQILSPLRPLETDTHREMLIVDWAGRVISSTDPARSPMTELTLPGVSFQKRRGSAEFTDGATDRVATYVPIPGGDWTLLVIDDPAVVFATERRLEARVLGASRVAGIVALILGFAIALLYLYLVRQRRVLAASSAALRTALSELSASHLNLTVANAQLDAANAELDAFAYSVSHDLRAPLRAIDG